MTRKDYVLIAKVLSRREGNTVQELLNWGHMCNDMAREFAVENPRFNRETFLKACGFDEAFGKGQW
jgi:hypothetical protein